MKTATAGELIALLADYPEDTPVLIGTVNGNRGIDVSLAYLGSRHSSPVSGREPPLYLPITED